jgi:hypothetical protein
MRRRLPEEQLPQEADLEEHLQERGRRGVTGAATFISQRNACGSRRRASSTAQTHFVSDIQALYTVSAINCTLYFGQNRIFSSEMVL